MIQYYLLVFPTEALIASSLSPRKFGAYMALGSEKGSKDRLIFFQLQGEFGSHFDWSYAHQVFSRLAEGEVKHSLYLSVYRTLERIPLEMLGDLFLTTRDGHTLQLEQGDYSAEFNGKDYYLYQELCPINPLVVSLRNPHELAASMTDPKSKVWVPKLVFADLKAIDFDNPSFTGNIGGRYDHSIKHLRTCIRELKESEGHKYNKTFDRSHTERFSYQIIDHAIYVADADRLLTYPMPRTAELNRSHFRWAKSAGIV